MDFRWAISSFWGPIRIALPIRLSFPTGVTLCRTPLPQASPVPLPDILALKGLHPFSMKALATRFCVHVDAQAGDAQAFAALAPRIVGLVASGESKVPGSLMAQLPALKAVSVFGVGHDGINVARGSVVDEAARLAALADGSIAGAVIDVLDPRFAPVAHQATALERLCTGATWSEGPVDGQSVWRDAVEFTSGHTREVRRHDLVHRSALRHRLRPRRPQGRQRAGRLPHVPLRSRLGRTARGPRLRGRAQRAGVFARRVRAPHQRHVGGAWPATRSSSPRDVRSTASVSTPPGCSGLTAGAVQG